MDFSEDLFHTDELSKREIHTSYETNGHYQRSKKDRQSSREILAVLKRGLGQDEKVLDLHSFNFPSQ